MTCFRRFTACASPAGWLVLALAVVLFTPSRSAAQAANGTLLGTVTDESGAGVPGATVTATEVQTNIPRTAVSNQTGYYIFTGIPSGLYRVEGELQGFKKFVSRCASTRPCAWTSR